MAVVSDAERLGEIQQLERVVASRQPELSAAAANLDQTHAAEAERRATLNSIDAQIAGVGTQVHYKGGGVYLSGTTLDRGTLSLGNERVWFSGWHGTAEIPLAEIDSIEIGSSHLGPRVGVPLVSHVWPGQPRQRQTLLLGITDQQESVIAVIADLPDAEQWRREILGRQQLLSNVTARRADLGQQRAAAIGLLNEATAAVQCALVVYQRIESEIATLRTQANNLRTQQREIDKARADQVAKSKKR